METPFVFGKVATKDYFTNRQEETLRLKNNFLMGTNTILISPRRWGKSSLVFHAAEEIIEETQAIKFVFIDLFNVRTEEQFYELLAKEVLKVYSKKIDDLLENSRKFLRKLLPKISITPTPESEFSLAMDWKEVKKNPEEILNLSERLSQQKNSKIIICIDEFQNISFFEEPLAFQKKLRANWQLHKNSSYCLFGSKRHMMMDVFTSKSMPFYKFGDIVFLEKIKEDEWVEFIKGRFKKSGKKISSENSKLIAQLTKNHPFYVQQLAQLSWLRTNENCTKEIIEESFESLVMQLSMLFHSETDNLSSTQLGFLKALINGEERLSSRQAIEQYKMGTSANVQRIKKALISKEIVDIQKNKIFLLDPVYEYWLKHYYFK